MNNVINYYRYLQHINIPESLISSNLFFFLNQAYHNLICYLKHNIQQTICIFDINKILLLFVLCCRVQQCWSILQIVNIFTI